MSKFSHNDNDDDTKSTAIPGVFSENSRAKKKKMLVTTIFSCSHNVFKSLPSQGSQNPGYFGKRLIYYLMTL